MKKMVLFITISVREEEITILRVPTSGVVCNGWYVGRDCCISYILMCSLLLIQNAMVARCKGHKSGAHLLLDGGASINEASSVSERKSVSIYCKT